MAEFCGFHGVSMMKNLLGKVSPQSTSLCFRHESHGGHGAHEQARIKTKAANGSGRKASLYRGLGPLPRGSVFDDMLILCPRKPGCCRRSTQGRSPPAKHLRAWKRSPGRCGSSWKTTGGPGPYGLPRGQPRPTSRQGLSPADQYPRRNWIR